MTYVHLPGVSVKQLAGAISARAAFVARATLQW
jgi:hypothetical protein